MADNVIVRVPEQQFIRGEDGYSPEVTIENIDHGHSVTITDRDHPTGQSFNVVDGDSAYEQAVAGGYTGTEAQFNEELASFKELSEQAADSANTAAGAAFRAQNYERHAEDAESAASAYADIALIRMNSADASAQDAEAYAIGKRNGIDVAAGDPASNNNSKYYMELAAHCMAEASSSETMAASSMRNARNFASSAQDSAGQATSSASDAAAAKTAAETAQGLAESAQAAAETAQGAAEDAQAAAEAVLASIPADYTELSSDVDDLKSALNVQNNVSVKWELGTIDTFDGGDEASTTRARSIGYINKHNRTLLINVPDGLKCSIRYYSEDQESGYVKLNVNPLPTTWNTGTVILGADQPDYARIVISYTDNRPINAEAGNSFSIILDGVVNAQDMQDELKDTIESVSSVTNELHVAPKAFLKWVRGSIDTYNGTNVSSNNRIRSQYIQYDTSCAIIISDDMKYSYRTYKRDGTYIGSSGWIEHGGELLLNDDVASVRFVCAYINDADILPDDAFVFDVQFSQDRQGYSITKNESATGNITIRAAKTIMCNDGTPPLIDWYLLQTVNNQFYRSKDLRSKEYLFTFMPPTGDVANWSAGITATNDIIFVANAAGLSDTAGRLNDSNRVNPVCYLASEDYSVMHVVDFGTSLKPCGWLGNVGYCVLPNGNAVFCEYTRGTVKTANVWTITGDATEPDNWRTTWSTDIIDDTGVTAAGIKHCHEMQYDFYTGVLYMGTGDSPTGSFNYYSTDNGATWELLYGPDKNRCRRLTFVFTEEKVYWASDSYETDYHHFFIAERNSAGIVDVGNAQEVSLISNNSQACYGCVYLKSLNAIVMMDRVDGNGSDHLDWYCYDIDSGTVKLIGTINAANGSGPIFPGFRCTFVDWYPVENAIQTGFNPEPSPIQPDTNQNALCGNIIGRGYCGVGRINNLTLFVYKNGNNYSYRANTIIV